MNPDARVRGTGTPFEDVFRDEIVHWVKPRRKTRDAERIEPQLQVANGLFGLALSGGGLRAATYSLGVTQALADEGLLEKADYLSMVSGGGYMGNGAITYVAESIADEQPMAFGKDSYPFKIDYDDETHVTENIRPDYLNNAVESEPTFKARKYANMLASALGPLDTETWSALAGWVWRLALLWAFFLLPIVFILAGLTFHLSGRVETQGTAVAFSSLPMSDEDAIDQKDIIRSLRASLEPPTNVALRTDSGIPFDILSEDEKSQLLAGLMTGEEPEPKVVITEVTHGIWDRAEPFADFESQLSSRVAMAGVGALLALILIGPLNSAVHRAKRKPWVPIVNTLQKFLIAIFVSSLFALAAMILI